MRMGDVNPRGKPGAQSFSGVKVVNLEDWEEGVDIILMVPDLS